MDLNGIIFPSPRFDYCIEDYENELIFIEKKKKNSNSNNEEHIPLLTTFKLNLIFI
jgi:hypothetical protein